VQLSEYNPFGRIPVDQTMEETINKDMKTPGGIKSFSRNFRAVQRHYVAAETHFNCLKQLRILTTSAQPGLSHPDLSTGCEKRDECDVQKIMDLLQNNWNDPFNNDQSQLVSLSSGRTASSSF